MARNSSRQSAALRAGEMFAAESTLWRLTVRRPVEKVWPLAPSSASSPVPSVEAVNMKFVRAIWKLLVGIKDALVLIFMLLFFAMLYAALSARPTPVRDGVLALDLKGSVVEQPAKLEFADVAGGSRARQYRLRDLVAALDEAKDDSRV